MLTQTTNMAGAVGRFAASYWLVESTAVRVHAMKVSVELATSAFQHAATAVKSRRTSCVAIVRRRSKADSVTPQRTGPRPLKNGGVNSSVQTPAVASTTAASMLAEKSATDRTLTRLIAHVLPTSSLTVRVARHACRKYQMLAERVAKTPYRTALNLATTH